MKALKVFDKIKRVLCVCIVLALFGQNLMSQIIPVYNWYHHGDKDWVTIAGDQRMESSGYVDQKLVYKASLTQNPGMIAINRWYHESEGDWATLAATYGTDASLIASGYQDKTFLFYAYPTQQPGTIKVNLWYHAGEKDYVSLPTDYATDEKLIEWGYQKNNNGGFYAYPKDYVSRIDLSGITFQKSCITVYDQPNHQGQKQEYCDAGDFSTPFVIRSMIVPAGFLLRAWEGDFQMDYTTHRSDIILSNYNPAITILKTRVIPVATWQNALNGVFGASCVRLNNYTPNQNQYDRNERQFYRPNDSYIKLNFNGSPINYPIPIELIQTGPDKMYKMYINDWNTSRIVATPDNDRIKISLFFEDNGVEVVGNCYNNFWCGGSPAPNFDYTNARIDIYLDLVASGGQISYNASNTFTANVAESGPCVNNFFAFLCPSDRAGLIKGNVEATLNNHLNSPAVKILLGSVLSRLLPSGTTVNGLSVTSRGDIQVW